MLDVSPVSADIRENNVNFYQMLIEQGSTEDMDNGGRNCFPQPKAQ
jgi:hypothetical protein